MANPENLELAIYEVMEEAEKALSKIQKLAETFACTEDEEDCSVYTHTVFEGLAKAQELVLMELHSGVVELVLEPFDVGEIVYGPATAEVPVEEEGKE